MAIKKEKTKLIAEHYIIKNQYFVSNTLIFNRTSFLFISYFTDFSLLIYIRNVLTFKLLGDNHFKNSIRKRFLLF